ncbi:MAG: hypothetical protein OXB92_02885 [Acidimicrobiaceae bacterium]|nr:hypothetical protein [Acidimicrobiia bacterium]MCY4492789.1 hypothetical protein [Acidimicrobiaceae bacterium]
MEFRRSAFKHGLDRDAILHGLAHALVVDLELASDPPRVLAIGAESGWERAGVRLARTRRRC